MDIISFTAEQILNISTPEQLFSSNYKSESKRLLQRWHPDRNKSPQATDVFQHIKKLAEMAKHKLEQGNWEGHGTLSFIDKKTNKNYRINYSKSYSVDIGTMLIGKRIVAFRIPIKYKKYYTNYISIVSDFPFSNDKIRKAFESLIPTIQYHGETTNDEYIIVINKPFDMILAYDLYQHEKPIDIKHIAWMIGCLENLSVLFEKSNIVHLGITPKTVFISPSQHSVMIIGGWWFTAKINHKPIGLTRQILQLLPKKITVDKKAVSTYDQILLRKFILYMMGDSSMNGSKFLMDSSVAPKLLMWLREHTPLSTNIECYQQWDKLVISVFGKRKFVKWNSPFNIY